jgi:hypothetical protein
VKVFGLTDHTISHGFTSVKTFVKVHGIVAEFGKIDNPVEASFEAWQEESEDLGKEFSNLALAQAT